MTRRALREQIFKLLFRVEFNSAEEMEEQCGLFFQLSDEDTCNETIGEEDEAYIQNKYDNIVDRLSDIDAAIDEKTRGWTTDRMSKVDLAIIRLGVYEILYDDDIPANVAINEAVEIAKEFGQDESYSFVNGVLGKFV